MRVGDWRLLIGVSVYCICAFSALVQLGSVLVSHTGYSDSPGYGNHPGTSIQPDTDGSA